MNQDHNASGKQANAQEGKSDNRQRTGRWKLFAVIAICASPLIASYFTYYVIKPQGRTNYGTLLDPRAFPLPQLAATTLDGKSIALSEFKGKWVMLHVDNAACQEPCVKKLFEMRQLRLMQGKNMDRIERVWLITDEQPLETAVMRAYDGTHMLRMQSGVLKAWLPTEDNTGITDHVYMIDPLGNLMMRFPKDADPTKVKKDLSKLLKASSIG